MKKQKIMILMILTIIMVSNMPIQAKSQQLINTLPIYHYNTLLKGFYATIPEVNINYTNIINKYADENANFIMEFKALDVSAVSDNWKMLRFDLPQYEGIFRSYISQILIDTSQDINNVYLSQRMVLQQIKDLNYVYWTYTKATNSIRIQSAYFDFQYTLSGAIGRYISIHSQWTKIGNDLRERIVVSSSNSILGLDSVINLDVNHKLYAWSTSTGITSTDFLLWHVSNSRNFKNSILRVRCVAMSNSYGFPLDYSDFNTLLGNIESLEPDNPDFEELEPDLPYWSYNTYKLDVSNTRDIYFEEIYQTKNLTTNELEDTIFSFNYEFKDYSLTVESKKYFYNTQTIDPNSWGDWTVNNWFRDLIVMLLNSMINLIQLVMYLLVIGLQFLIIAPFLFILMLINNYMVYYVIFALIGAIFYILFAFVWIFNNISAILVWLWEKILWVWDNVIYPFLLWLWQDIIQPIWNWIYDNILTPIWEYLVNAWSDFSNWFINEGMFLIFNAMIIIISFIISLILFVLSFGTLNWDTTYLSVKEFITVMNTFFVELINIFINDGLALLTYSGMYLILFGLGYMKYIFAKSKGNISRSEKIQSQLNVFKIPIVVSFRIMQFMFAFIQGSPNSEK